MGHKLTPEEIVYGEYEAHKIAITLQYMLAGNHMRTSRRNKSKYANRHKIQLLNFTKFGFGTKFFNTNMKYFVEPYLTKKDNEIDLSKCKCGDYAITEDGRIYVFVSKIHDYYEFTVFDGDVARGYDIYANFTVNGDEMISDNNKIIQVYSPKYVDKMFNQIKKYF